MSTPDPDRRAYAYYYLSGRGDADEEYSTEDVNLPLIASRVLDAGEDLVECCRAVVKDELAVDLHDGSKDRWVRDNRKTLREDGCDQTRAWDEWRKGYIEAAGEVLAEDVEHTMWELLGEEDGDGDEDDADDDDAETVDADDVTTDVQSPRALRRARA